MNVRGEKAMDCNHCIHMDEEKNYEKYCCGCGYKPNEEWK